MKRCLKVITWVCVITVIVLSYLDDHDILTDRNLAVYNFILGLIGVVCYIVCYTPEK